ncbi:MAG: type II secretion system F family protein [Pirellulales bacterium]|nr:type II secretion system F family protein [Pirellulales bacterium]
MTEPDKPQHGERLSAEDAVDAVGQIAELTKSGMTLAPGLRALAAEAGHGASSRMFRTMAEYIERGATFDEAVAAVAPRLPKHIRAIFTAGANNDQLVKALDELVDLDRDRLELRRQTWLVMAYPTFLLAALVGLFAFLGGLVIPQFAKIFSDFEIDLPAMTELVIALSGRTTYLVLGMVVAAVIVAWILWMLPGPPLLRRMQKAVPFLGPLRRWGGLVRFTRLMAILLEGQVPLPEALRITATAVADPDLSAGCKRIAAHVEHGGSLSEGLALSGSFPPTIVPLVQWGQQHSSLPEAFRTATEVFEGRAETHIGFLDMVLAPFVFLVFITTIPFIIIALFMPLISLIQRLT